MAQTNGHNGDAAPGAASLAFTEGLYEDYLRDPASVPPDWQRYFSQVAEGEFRFPKPRFGPSFRPASLFNPPTTGRGRVPSQLADPEIAAMQDRVYLLTRLYRVRGHRIAQVDPLGLPQPVPPELKPEFFGFTEADMDQPVYSETFQYDGPLTLGKLLERLRHTYCRSIGVQYMHIDDLSVRRWLQRVVPDCEFERPGIARLEILGAPQHGFAEIHADDRSVQSDPEGRNQGIQAGAAA